MAETLDYFDLALTTAREQFVARCPFPFFVGADVLKRPQGPSQTMVFDGADELTAARRITPPPSSPGTPEERPKLEERPKPLILPVRKVQPVFPSMISIGRTANNDVVVADVQVSKVHAFVRVANGQHEIADAGSRNGTFVGGDRLVVKGPARVLLSGERVRFGTLEFVFFNAETCWSRLRTWRR